MESMETVIVIPRFFSRFPIFLVDLVLFRVRAVFLLSFPLARFSSPLLLFQPFFTCLRRPLLPFHHLYRNRLNKRSVKKEKKKKKKKPFLRNLTATHLSFTKSTNLIRLAKASSQIPGSSPLISDSLSFAPTSALKSPRSA